MSSSTKDVPVIERTETGYIIRHRDRAVSVPDGDAFQVWLALGLLLDAEFDGQLNRLTRGALAALLRQYERAVSVKTGN